MSTQKLMDIALKSIENQQANEATGAMAARVAASLKDLGPPESLRHTILSHVSNEKYDRAIKELHAYVESQQAYPAFQARAGKVIGYCTELINAIKAKRTFPGLNQLQMSKQMELISKAMAHFDDLKATLKNIEAIEREVKLEDIRSTVLVVKAVVYSVFAILLVGFFYELSKGLLPSAMVILDSTFGDLTNWLFDHIGV